MSDVGKMRATLGEAMAENSAHTRFVSRSAEEVKGLYGVIVDMADHLSAALDAGEMVVRTTDQVGARLRSEATEDHRKQVANMFSIALFGNGTGLDNDVARGLVAANGGESTAENTLGISNEKLRQALGHIASALELVRPDMANTAASRLHNAEAALSTSVEARTAVSAQVQEYIGIL